MNTIKAEFERFISSVGSGLSPETKENLCSVFHAGYAACFSSVMENAQKPTEMQIAEFKKKNEELTVYYQSIVTSSNATPKKKKG